jgi:hypothetical protein
MQQLQQTANRAEAATFERWASIWSGLQQFSRNLADDKKFGNNYYRIKFLDLELFLYSSKRKLKMEADQKLTTARKLRNRLNGSGGKYF